MRLDEFHIGLQFECGPFRYLCTDVGSRTVTAIPMTEADPKWYAGPPYMLKEHVLGERELQDAYPTQEELLLGRVADAGAEGHPGYLAEDMQKMLKLRASSGWATQYPAGRRTLDFDRVREDGEILHPYLARRSPGDPASWDILVFLPFTRGWCAIPEAEFLALPLATPLSVRARSGR